MKKSLAFLTVISMITSCKEDLPLVPEKEEQSIQDSTGVVVESWDSTATQNTVIEF